MKNLRVLFAFSSWTQRIVKKSSAPTGEAWTPPGLAVVAAWIQFNKLCRIRPTMFIKGSVFQMLFQFKTIIIIITCFGENSWRFWQCWNCRPKIFRCTGPLHFCVGVCIAHEFEVVCQCVYRSIDNSKKHSILVWCFYCVQKSRTKKSKKIRRKIRSRRRQEAKMPRLPSPPLCGTITGYAQPETFMIFCTPNQSEGKKEKHAQRFKVWNDQLFYQMNS